MQHLLSRVDGSLVHPLVPLCEDEVELPLVAEGAPLGVDHHVAGLGAGILVPHLNLGTKKIKKKFSYHFEQKYWTQRSETFQ